MDQSEFRTGELQQCYKEKRNYVEAKSCLCRDLRAKNNNMKNCFEKNGICFKMIYGLIKKHFIPYKYFVWTISIFCDIGILLKMMQHNCNSIDYFSV